MLEGIRIPIDGHDFLQIPCLNHTALVCWMCVSASFQLGPMLSQWMDGCVLRFGVIGIYLRYGLPGSVVANSNLIPLCNIGDDVTSFGEHPLCMLTYML